MPKRKTRSSMADQNQTSSSKTAESGGSAKAPRVTPVPEGGRRPPQTPTADEASYDTSVPFEFRNWSVGSRFHIKRFLGRGSYGSVCEAFDKVTKSRVAIKRITDLFEVKVGFATLCAAHRLFFMLFVSCRRMQSGFFERSACCTCFSTPTLFESSTCTCPSGATSMICTSFLSAWTQTLANLRTTRASS